MAASLDRATSTTFYTFDDGPEQVAPYSHAAEHNGLLFVTGQMPIAADGSIPEGIEAQTLVALENIRDIAKKAGAEHGTVIQMRVYLRDFDAHYTRMNQTYQQWFTHQPLPTRTCIGVTGLARGCAIEIDAVIEMPHALRRVGQ